jgi:hypothetical protein
MEITYESDIQLGQLFKSLGAAFARLAKGMDPAKEQQELKDVATKLNRAKGFVHVAAVASIQQAMLHRFERHATMHLQAHTRV